MSDVCPPSDLRLSNASGDQSFSVDFQNAIATHAGWLFAAAYRQFGDPHLAEDATQTVFLLLLQKAPSMRSQQKLSGWLFNTLHFAIKNIRRSVRRRRFHEHRAAVESKLTTAGRTHDSDLAVHLDQVVHGLSAGDRDVILLRFYQDLPLPVMAGALNLSEHAARKRLNRAVNRLKRRLASASDSNTVASAARVGLAATPLTMVPNIMQAARSAQAGVISPTMLTAMQQTKSLMALAKLKTNLTLIGLCLLVVAPLLWITSFGLGAQSATIRAAASPQTQPTRRLLSDSGLLATSKPASDTPQAADDHDYHLANSPTGNYSATPDPDEMRNNQPTLCIQPTGKSSATWCWYGTSMHAPGRYLGHRVRLSAWIKTQNVTGVAHLAIYTRGADGKPKRIDDPASRSPINGTHDWKKYQLIADVPSDLTEFSLGFNLAGSGKTWIDELQYELIPDDTGL